MTRKCLEIPRRTPWDTEIEFLFVRFAYFVVNILA